MDLLFVTSNFCRITNSSLNLPFVICLPKGEVCNQVNLHHFCVGLDLAFGGRTEQRNYIEMGLSTPGVAKVMAMYYIGI